MNGTYKKPLTFADLPQFRCPRDCFHSTYTTTVSAHDIVEFVHELMNEKYKEM